MLRWRDRFALTVTQFSSLLIFLVLLNHYWDCDLEGGCSKTECCAPQLSRYLVYFYYRSFLALVSMKLFVIYLSSYYNLGI